MTASQSSPTHTRIRRACATSAILLALGSHAHAAPRPTLVNQNVAIAATGDLAVPSPNGNGFESALVTGATSFHIYGLQSTSDGRKWIPYWTFLGNAGITQRHRGYGHPSQDANHNNNAPNRAAFVRSDGELFSTKHDVPAGVWRVRFDATQRLVGTTIDQQVLRVLLNDEVVGEIKPGEGHGTAIYREYASRPVRTTATGSLTVKFEGMISGQTAMVDDVFLESVREWSADSTWSSGSAPVAGDDVVIPTGVEVAIDEGNCIAGTTTVEGELLVLDGVTSLSTDWLMVRRNVSTDVGPDIGRDLGGRFEAGLPGATLSGSFHLTLTDADSSIAGANDNFFMAMKGGQIHLHGEQRSAWTSLTGVTDAPPFVEITVKDSVDWDVGDTIVIAGSHIQDADGYGGANCDNASGPAAPAKDEAERMVVVGVDLTPSGGGAPRYLLTRPAPITGIPQAPPGSTLYYAHSTFEQEYDNVSGAMLPKTSGHRPVTWTLDQRAEVGLLSRNITIQGQESQIGTKFGGHIMVSQGGDYDAFDAALYASNVEFRYMGQQGKIGRYPIHWHMMLDGGLGQYVRDCSIHDSFHRAVTIHGTDGIEVSSNVVYRTLGHAMFLEDGSEQLNTFDRNLVIETLRPAFGEQAIPSDNQLCAVQNRTPAAFWITNPVNTFTNNVVAGTPGTAYWLIFPTYGVLGQSRGSAHSPKPPGADEIDAWALDRKPILSGLLLFSGNRAHGCGSGFDVNDSIDPATHLIDSNSVWLRGSNTNAFIDDFVAYGCFDGIYTGPGNFEAPIEFRHPILADNVESLRIGVGTEIVDALLVAETGSINDPAPRKYRSGFVYYDGLGDLDNCHFVGFGQDSPLMNYQHQAAVFAKGGQVVRGQNEFRNITFPGVFPADQPYIRFVSPGETTPGVMDPYDICSGAGDAQSVRKWGPTIRLGDGSLWRSDNALDPADTLPRSITGQHPLVVAAGGTITPASGLQSWPGSNGARLSADRYGLVRFANTGPLLPVTVTREHYSYNGRVAPGAGPYCLKETAQSGDNRMFPAIIDRGFVYTLEPETASSWPSIVNLRVSDLDDGSDPMDGDLVILCFKGFSSFSPRVDRIGNGATSVPDYGGIPTASYSENEVKYHWDPATGDLWLAIVGPGDPNLNEVNLHLRP